MNESLDQLKEAQHVPLAQLARNTAYELILTFILLFGVTTIVRWVIGPSLISRSIPQIHAELVLVGAGVALLLAGLILSPMGRASGGHMNPAISLAMWRFGVFPGAGVVPYSIAQLLGSVLGVLAARVVWGQVVAEPPVVYAVLQPGPLWSTAELFTAETLSMAVIVLIVGMCLAEDRLAPFVPWVVGILIGMAIAVLGTSTGGSVNPARQFGPAVVSGQTHFLSVYLLAPMLGAVIAAWLRQTIQHRRAVVERTDYAVPKRTGAGCPISRLRARTLLLSATQGQLITTGDDHDAPFISGETEDACATRRSSRYCSSCFPLKSSARYCAIRRRPTTFCAMTMFRPISRIPHGHTISGRRSNSFPSTLHLEATSTSAASSGSAWSTSAIRSSVSRHEAPRPMTCIACCWRAICISATRFRTFIQFGNYLVTSPSMSPPTDVDHFDLQQGFADLKASIGQDASLTFRGGRQEMTFGAGRLVDVREGPNVRLSFDGGRVFYESPALRIDAFGAAPVVVERGVFDDRSIARQPFPGQSLLGPL